MPIGDPRDRFLYPILLFMMDSYRVCISECIGENSKILISELKKFKL